MQHITIRRTAAFALALALVLAAPGGALAAELALATGDRLVLAAGETLSSAITVAAGATLAGAGTIAGDATVDGTLEVGETDAQAGTLAFRGGLTLNAGAVTRVDLLNAGAAGSDYDRLDVTGGAISLGGTLKAVLADGYTPAVNAAFDVISASAGIDGAFDNVAGGRVAPFLPDGGLAPLTFRYETADSMTVRLLEYENPPQFTGTVISF
jgi:hypothetical protein